ncbi:DUF2785 domain-containing protein [Streptomyces mangrovisoli]|uniref:DUF2785 domain-containing protein n=1 Tax=Streptomyces mangrovisoli TaxID=1428628 RepID=A0A1J4NT00_9ACTN|nr:DUF2785 domain-containing protein [Streptomyces mangrovisoli]OIJ64684.1 hypothetical protein WN71_027705 [Streptomyces mangrovisoli]
MVMTQWHDGGIEEQGGVDVALGRLVDGLRAVDPQVRDDGAYLAAVRWIPGMRTQERCELGDRVAGLFADPAVQARAFAPLVLARIADAGDWRDPWWRAFADWYPAETDLRGHDPVLGWVHAVAHGADLLAALARRPGQDPVPLAESAVARLLAPTDHVLDAQEDDRVAYALARVLSRPDLTEEQSVRWLEPVARAFATGEPGPVPAWASNTMRTLRMLYVVADRGLRTRGTEEPLRHLTHRTAVLEALGETLAIVAPWSG